MVVYICYEMRQRIIYILLIVFTFSSELMLSQGTPPGSNDPPCWPPPCVPIDGGVGFLVAIAAAIGIKKIYFSKK